MKSCNFFCLHTREYQNTPCIHGTCRMMDYKKPPSISEEKKAVKR